LPVDALAVTGAPGAGKTVELARAAGTYAQAGRVLVVCSHVAACRTFESTLAREDLAAAAIAVDTFAGHLARLMRADYASAGVAPNFVSGGAGAAMVIVKRAAQGLLDLSWPELRDGAIDLNLPYARRPGALLDEAAALIALLRRTRVAPSEFFAGCVAGLSAFYGEDVERARGLLGEAQLARRGSKRAREAMLAGDETLREQRRAERDLSIVLTHLYGEYVVQARRSAVKAESDVIGDALDWLSGDPVAARRAFAGCSAIVVDDAEDAEPALGEFISIAQLAGVTQLAVAGREASGVDEFHGRRPLRTPANARAKTAGPPPASPHLEARRFVDEREEADWIALRIADLIRSGAEPHEIAVLSRDSDAAAIYATLLVARGLPAMPPPQDFAAPSDIADLFALAIVADDPYDQARLLRVLASPLVGLCDATLWTLCGDAAAVAQLQLDVGGTEQKRGRDRGAVRTLLADNVLNGAADAELPDASRDVLQRFRIRLAAWRAMCATRPPADAFAALVLESGFAARWRQMPAYAAARLADDAARIAAAFAGAAAAGVASGFRSAVELLESNVVIPRPAARTSGAITCDGIVGVKGERFMHVIVAGVAHERFPRIYVSRAMAFSRKYGLIVRENVADGAAQTAKFAWYYAKFEAKRRYLDGERRALRYGLSRAIASAAVTGYGSPPHWAKDEDLLREFLPARS
jgi:hypothetical protein